MSVSIVRREDGETLQVLGVGVRFICHAEDTNRAWSLMENVIPRDAGPPAHHHAWAEAYYLISGEVEFEIDGRKQRVRGGDFVLAPGGTVHGFRGVSDEPARMLIIDAPAHAEAFFENVHREVREMPRDLPKLPVIGESHGIHFLPPAA
jgi:quercetin dioxygenase-like cupin family protein